MPPRPSLALLFALTACGDKADPGQDGSADGADGSAAPVDQDGDGYNDAVDCDDTNGAVSPGAQEVCDGLDNDCDGLVDDADDSLDPATGVSGFVDADGDGFGDPEAPVEACALPADAVTDATDCDDADATAHPDAQEVCDGGVDNDCDGQADDADDSTDPATLSTWYRDGDGDGHGDAEAPGQAGCAPPADGRTYAPVADDCDDDEPAAHPGADEVCDGGIDNDCDGLVDQDDDSLDPDDLPIWHLDADNDGWGDPESEGVAACEDPSSGDEVRVPNAGDCDDTSAARSPDATEVCDDSIDNDCDGDVNEVCRDADDADWSFDGDAGESIGYRVAMGDFDGDGTGDVATSGIRRPHADGTPYGGSAYVLSGPLSAGALGPTSATAHLEAGAGREFFGYSLAAAGDLDADGFAELLVGAEGWPEGDFQGALFVFDGPLSGTLDPDDADAAFTGAEAYGYVGYTLSAQQGDIDGDGLADLALGAWYPDAGAAYLFVGPLTADRDTDAADATFTGAASSDGFGIWVEAGADLDGDGLDDLLVGADDADTAYAFLAPFASEVAAADADFALTGDAGTDFGGSVRHADVDGDGAPDVLVGARFDATDGDRAGAWYLFGGPTSSVGSTAAVATITGGATRRQVGSPLHQDALGDLDQDGFDDLLLSDRYADSTETSAGAVSVLLGPLTGTHTVADGDLRLRGEAVEDGYFGTGVALGDLDGDGAPDVAVGAPGIGDTGRLYGFLGAGL